MYEEYLKILEPIIEKHILNLESEKYYWNSKYNKIMPRSAILELETFLSMNKIEFKHKVNNGEYTEVYLDENKVAHIYANKYFDNDWLCNLEFADNSLCVGYESTKEEVVDFISRYKAQHK